MKVIEITEEKAQKMSDLVEEMLTIGGKLMTCVSQLKDDDDEANYRRNRMSYRDDRYERDNYRDMDNMNYRRDNRGRYM